MKRQEHGELGSETHSIGRKSYGLSPGYNAGERLSPGCWEKGGGE